MARRQSGVPSIREAFGHDAEAIRIFETEYDTKKSRVTDLDGILLDLLQSKYPIPCYHDMTELLLPGQVMCPNLAQDYEMAHLKVVEAKSRAEAAVNGNVPNEEKLKLLKDFCKDYSEFSAKKAALAEGIRIGAEKRAVERKERDSFVYG